MTNDLQPGQQSLRDYFAAAALPEMLRSYGTVTPGYAEAEAFEIADRMLAARDPIRPDLESIAPAPIKAL